LSILVINICPPIFWESLHVKNIAPDQNCIRAMAKHRPYFF
jgi:hypothetical protein